MKTVFISRELTADSPFYQLLTQKGMEVTGASLITLAPVTFASFPSTDWLFFYSKNGVAFFFSQLPDKDFLRAGAMKIAAYGPATADAVRKAGLEVAFTGTGHAATTAPAFLKLAGGTSVLFARATHSRHALLPYLSPQVKCLDLIVYENKPLASPAAIALTDYVVLTSPSNVNSYLQCVTPQPFQRYIAIGETTAKALAEAGIGQVVRADYPSEVSLAEAIINLENNTK